MLCICSYFGSDMEFSSFQMKVSRTTLPLWSENCTDLHSCLEKLELSELVQTYSIVVENC
jgi:hypothetical protein